MKNKILVLVKAEPNPSKKYGDSVCTAGITERGEFVRLYPVPYRIFCDPKKKFRKYDWIEVDCKKSDNDRRKESYKINPDSIKVVGHIETDMDWMERNNLILPHVSKNIKELDKAGASLGIIKPTEILKLEMDCKEDTSEIKKEFSKLRQTLLDIENIGEMKSIPIISNMDRHFSYTFKCKDDETTHNIICEDWEIYQSSRDWIKTYKTEEAVWEKIHDKFYNKFTTENDLHFFMGTHYLYKTWIIIGLYYPPKKSNRQTQLPQYGQSFEE